jgi:hypothetical protein
MSTNGTNSAAAPQGDLLLARHSDRDGRTMRVAAIAGGGTPPSVCHRYPAGHCRSVTATPAREGGS